MRTNAILTFAIGAVVAIILMGSLLVPVLDDLVDDHTQTYYNNTGGSPLKYAMNEDDHLVTYTANGTTLTVDEETYTIGSTYIYAISDTVIILASTNGISIFNGSTQVLSTSKIYDVSVEYSEGTATITYGTTTVTGTYAWLYIADPAGDHILTTVSDSSTVYFNSFEELATAQKLSGYQAVLFDGAATYNGSEATYAATTAEQSGTNGTISYMTGKLSITSGGTTVTPTYVIAKESVSYTDDAGNQMGALLAPLPILIIIAILLGAVGLVAKNRD